MRKGFTLIELLAVIVVLAAVLAIVTPIVMNLINDSKSKTKIASVEMYGKALKQAAYLYEIETGLEPITFEDIESYIEYKGNKIECETIKIHSGGKIYISNCYIDGKKIKAHYGEPITYNDGQVIYIDVETGLECSEEDYHLTNSNDGYNGYGNRSNLTSETLTDRLSTQTTCLKFYAFGDKDGNMDLNLILDHATSKSFYNDSFISTDGPLTLIKNLKKDTENWVGIDVRKDSYTKQTYDHEGVPLINYTVEFTGSRARAIFVEEVAEIGKVDYSLEKDNIWLYEADEYLWLGNGWTASAYGGYVNY